MALNDRLKHAWNAFINNDEDLYLKYGNYYESTSYFRPDRFIPTRGNERSITTSVYNRIALDVASLDIFHAKLDENGRYKDNIKSGLNECLTLRANMDQSAKAFIQDIVLSMLDEGVVAVVPIDTNIDPYKNGSFDILSLRTAKIVEWKPSMVKVNVYNDRTGLREDIYVPKKSVAIIENPLYSVINEPNSTMQRLIRKLNLLDVIDEQSGSGKLDLIIQLPYTVKTKAKRDMAETRRKDIESQLMDSKYGIAYTDATERITQLNRPVENNLMKQIEYLTTMLYSQLGLSQSILDGTADEKTMLNYYNRTIDPIITAIVYEFKYKFLTKTARTQHQDIVYFRNPFKLVPVTEIAKIADTFTRNEIASSNEMRQVIGWKPSDDPASDELRNKNLNRQAQPLDSYPNSQNEIATNNETEEEYNYD